MAGNIQLSKRITFGLLITVVMFFSAPTMIIPAEASSGDGRGPGGVGSTNGASNLTLWLKADAGVYSDDACTAAASNGGSVACWADQSGYGNHFSQTTGGNQPTFTLSGINNQPILQFDGSSQFLERSFTSNLNTDNFTIFIVARTSGSGTSFRSPYASHCNSSGFVIYASEVDYWHFWVWKGTQWSKQIAYDIDVSTWHIVTGYYDADINMMQSIDIDGSNLDQDVPISYTKNSSCPTRIGAGETQLTSPNLYFPGSIAEIIVYNTALNLAERNLVNNYLSAKYNVDINNDKYSGSDPYIHNVAGIGMDDGNQIQGASVGMIVSDHGFLQENGDYIIIGHGGVSNDNSINDLPSGGDWSSNGMRWARDWQLTVTDKDSTGGAVDITFDLSEAGMSGSLAGSASNYRLLKREGTSGNFSDIEQATSISGDQVLFESVNVSELGSYFTLGTVDSTSSPTAVILRDFRQGANRISLIVAMIVLSALIGTYRFINRRKQERRF